MNTSQHISNFAKLNNAFKAYNGNLSKSTQLQNAYIQAVGKQNDSLGNYLAGLNGAKASMGGYIKSLIGAKAATIGLQAASLALNAAISMGIGLAINAVVSYISDLANASEIAKEKADGFTSSLKSFNSEAANNSSKISEINNRYNELSKKVGDLGQNLDLTSDEYEEYKKLVSQVSEIMPNLNVLYNAQGEKVKILTDNMVDLNKQYAIYRQQMAQKFLTKGDEDGNTVDDLLETINREKKTYNNDFEALWGVAKSNLPFTDNSDELLTPQAIKKYYDELLELNQKEMAKAFGGNSDISKTAKILNPMYSIRRIGDLFDKDRPYMEAIRDELNVDSSDILSMTEDEFKAFKEQLAAGIKEADLELKQYYNDLKFIFQQYAIAANSEDANWNNLSEEEQNNLNNFFNSLSDYTINAFDLKDTDGNFSKTKIAAFVNNLIASIDNESTGVSEALNKLFTLNPDNMPYQKYEDQINQIIKTIVENLNLSDEEKGKIIIPLKLQFGINTGSETNSLINKVKSKINDVNKFSGLDVENSEFTPEREKEVKEYLKNFEEINNWVDTLNKSDLEILYSIKAKDGWTLKDYEKALKDAKKEAETPVTPLSFADSLKELDKLTEAFSKVDKIYADVYDKEGFDFSNLFDDKFIETFGKYEEEYKNLIDTISKSPDDINACQSAFNNLVNAWFYGQDVLKNLNEENKNATIQYLKQNGIANASAIVEEQLAGKRKFTAFTTGELKGSTDALTNATNALNEVSSDNVSETHEVANTAIKAAVELLGEGEGSDYAKLELEKLIATQNVFSLQSLSTADKIARLEELATAFGDVTLKAMIASETIKAFGSATTRVYDDGTKIEYSAPDKKGNVNWKYYTSDGNVKEQGITTVNANDSNYWEARQYEALKKVGGYLNTKKTTSINYTGGSATQAAKDKQAKKSKSGGSAKGGSAKEHETNDEYYNFFQTKIEDYKNGADKLKKAIEETNEQIELAYKTGDTKLAKSLEAMLPQQTQQYKDYLAANAKAMRKMAKEEIYPIIYQIAPELKGKTIDQFSEKEKLEIKRRLDNAKTDAKNKVIDLENAQKDSDNKTKVSDADVKNAEKQLKILEELYSTLEKSYELVGNKAGEGEWSKNYREMINDQIDAIKDNLDKAIDQDEFNLSLFENMDNQEGMLNVYLQELDRYHNAAKKLKELGLSENSAEIQEQQKNYRETFEKIFELGKDVFEKLKKKREDALDTVEFKFDMTGEKEYGKQIELLNDETAIHQDNINKIIERMNALKKDYRNHIIVAAEYEEEIRSLNEELKEEVQNLKSIAEQKRDIEISKLDDQIDDLTRATEKQTKAIDEKIEALEEENDELNKLKDLYDKAYSAIQKVVDDQIEELNDLKEQEEEYWDEKLEALEKINDETTRGIELSEKQKALEKARQKTALVYHEGEGWKREENPNDLSAAQQDLDQWLIDDQFEQAKKSIEEQKEESLKAIEEQIEAWDNYIEKWEDAVNAYEEGQNRIAASTVIGANWEKSTLAQREDIIRKFETNYSTLLKQLDEDNKNSVENQIEEFNKQKDAIEKASDAQIEKLNNLKSAYEELFNDLSTDSVEWVKSIIEKWELDISVKEDLLKLLKVRKDELLNAKAEAEKPLAYNNDDITIIKQMMGYSQKWLEAINQQDKDQLHEKNMELAKALSFEVHFDNEKYSWFDENGDAIYSEEFLEKLEEEQKITGENSKITDTNTDVTEDNTTSTDFNTNATKDNNKALKGNKDALDKATNVGNDIVDAAESLTNALNNSSNSSSSGSTNSSSESSSSNTSSTVTYPTDGTPYTYSSTLVGEDIETAAKWFEDNHKTNPGTDIKVVHGGVSTLSVDLINQLGLNSGDLVALGKQLYYITGSGSYSRITGSLVNKYVKGSKYIPYDQIALVNEEGDELIASKNSQGDITKLRKGDEVVPAKDTQTLMSLVDWLNTHKHNGRTWEEILKEHIASIPIEYAIPESAKRLNYSNVINNNSNSKSVENNNYNVQKVELNNVQDPSGLFNGLSNMARQRAFRR